MGIVCTQHVACGCICLAICIFKPYFKQQTCSYDFDQLELSLTRLIHVQFGVKIDQYIYQDILITILRLDT